MPSLPPMGGVGGSGTYTIVVNWQKNTTDSWLERRDKATCMGESEGGAAPLLLPQELPLWPSEDSAGSRGTAAGSTASGSLAFLFTVLLGVGVL